MAPVQGGTLRSKNKLSTTLNKIYSNNYPRLILLYIHPHLSDHTNSKLHVQILIV